jgi:hypothetical protein
MGNKNISQTKDGVLLRNIRKERLSKSQIQKNKSEEIIKKFHKLYGQLTGKHHEHEKTSDLYVDDRYYEKFIIFEALNAFFSIFSIIFGVANYEFSYRNPDGKFTAYLYFCTFFSIFLWLNYIFYELSFLEFEKEKKQVSRDETLTNSGRYKTILLTILCVFIHPNPITDGLTYTSYNTQVKKYAIRKINAILTILLFTRIYFVLRFYLFSSVYMKPESNRVCKSYYFEASLDFSLKALLKSKPLTLYIIAAIVSIVFFSLSIQIFEREIQDPFNNYLTSVYYVLVTMATLGYGDYSAKTNEGRIIGMIACIFGVFLMSMIIISVNNLLEMSKGEQNALYIINKVYVNQDIINSAKKVINEFSKVVSSKHTLKNTILTENELFTPFKSALKEFGESNIACQNFSGDNSAFNKIYNSLSSAMNDHYVLEDKQKKNRDQLLKIKKEVEDIYDIVLENTKNDDENVEDDDSDNE